MVSYNGVKKMDKTNKYTLSGIKNVSMKEAAFKYAELGFKIFPVYGIDPSTNLCLCGDHNCRNKGKHPCVGNGYKEATDDLNQVNKWWKQYPNANIGISAKGSGLVIVDIDPRNGGYETIKKLEGEHENLPITLSASTSMQSGTRGNHYYFNAPAGDYKLHGGIGPGIDIKYEGYVVAPPSLPSIRNKI